MPQDRKPSEVGERRFRNHVWLGLKILSEEEDAYDLELERLEHGKLLVNLDSVEVSHQYIALRLGQ